MNAIRGIFSAAAVAAMLATVTVQADDIDIYASPSSSPTGAPKVMFTLDWRPNLSSTVCGGDECDFLVSEGYLQSTPTSFFNLLRAVLARVLSNLNGVEVGLMLNNNQGTGKSCSGPQAAFTGDDWPEYLASGESSARLDSLVRSWAADALAAKPGGGSASSNCTNGGFVLQGFTSVDDSVGMARFLSKLNAIPEPQGNASHPYQGAELFFELFRYLTGQGIHDGHNGWTNFGTDDDYNNGDEEDLPPTDAVTLGWDPSIENGSRYISPLLDGGGCGTKIYTINIMFQVSQQEDDSDSAITAGADAGGMAGISLRPPFKTAGKFGRILEYLQDVDLSANIVGDQNVTSYFIVDPTKINNTTNGYATAGGTGTALPLSEDPEVLIKTIEDIFSQILSVSTTFVSPSLPLNVFNRVDLVDDVYIAVFRADPDLKPFWNGNLKKLKLGVDGGGSPVLLDAVDAPAVNPLDGRINNTARTLWTYAEDIPAPPDGETDWTQGADGRATNHGGGGGVIPGFRPVTGYSPGLSNPSAGDTTSVSGPRRLFTETSAFAANTTNLMALNANDATAATLLDDDDDLFQTVMLPDELCDPVSNCDEYDDSSSTVQGEAVDRMVELLAFARGLEDSDDDGAFDDKRDWFLGDPLHSRPQPINYGGDPDNPDIRILMASNDGFMHLFGADDGVEDWAFMPRAVMPVLERLRDNNAGQEPVHPYTVDGSAATLVVDANFDGTISSNTPGDKAYAFFGLRRGGKHYYAIDVTNPDQPRLMWRIGPDDSGFGQMGQSWSRPRAIKVGLDTDNNANTPPVATWAVMFAGGYNGDDHGDDVNDPGESDLGKDARNDLDSDFTGGDDYEGNAIYIVNAETGALIWKATGPASSVETVTTGSASATHYRHADMRDSIASEISFTNVIPDDFDDRAYVGDTGGVLWRIDFGDPSTANWKVTRLFSAGRHYVADTANDRRFFHPVDIVRAEDALGVFDAVVIASGTRPHPLSLATNDHLYVIKDRATGATSADSELDHGDVADLSSNCLQDGDPEDCPGVTVTDDGVPVLTSLEKGWRIALNNCDDLETTGNCGEKGLSKPTTFLGKVFFTTFIPPGGGGDANACAPSEGTGVKYILSLQTAAAVRDLNAANNSADEIVLDRFEKLVSGGIPSEVIRIGTQNDKTVFINPDLSFDFDVDLSYLRTYWYRSVQP